ncbi:MAG: Gfo/Idh/MocA family protein [Bryobacteraceae bacterium]
MTVPAALPQRGANGRVGVAVVGVGTRGIYLLKEFQSIPNVEVRVICDLYDGHIKRAKEFCSNTKAKVTKEWEKAVTDRDADVVVIATPDFWHAPMVIAAAQNKKDIYVEKGWCLTLEQAKQMRKAVKDNGVMLQLGHNYNSMPTFHKAREMYKAGKIGRVPLVRTTIDRTLLLWPQWKFYGDYAVHELPKDAGPQTIDWQRFTANVTRREFDADRFFCWRNWWEYSNGIAGDLMSHLWDSVNMVLEMGIPETCYTQGNLYYWTKDQEVPDMWHVLFDYPKKQLAVTFNCNFHNRHTGEVAQYLGRDGTIDVSPRFCRYYRAEWADEDKPNAPRRQSSGPDYEMKPDELKVTSHWEDLIESVRTRKRPRCHEDRAFEEAAAIVMSVESYRRGNKVAWDPVKEEIV